MDAEIDQDEERKTIAYRSRESALYNVDSPHDLASLYNRGWLRYPPYEVARYNTFLCRPATAMQRPNSKGESG